MYKKYSSNDFETHKLEVTLIHKVGANSNSWNYKSMPKVQMKDEDFLTTNKGGNK